MKKKKLLSTLKRLAAAAAAAVMLLAQTACTQQEAQEAFDQIVQYLPSDSDADIDYEALLDSLLYPDGENSSDEEEGPEASATDVAVFGDFEYITDDSGAIITGYRGAGGDVVIPALISDTDVHADVYRIGKEAFRERKEILSLVIPDTVTEIGDFAFYRCESMASLELSKNLQSTGQHCFNSCESLSSVTVPASLTDYGYGMFIECDALRSIDVEEENPNYRTIDGVLYDKAGTTLLACPGGYEGSFNVPAGVETIGVGAFHACQKITSVGLNAELREIGRHAFSNMNITSIEVPASVQSIGAYAFYHCYQLSTIIIDGNPQINREHPFDGCPGTPSIVG